MCNETEHVHRENCDAGAPTVMLELMMNHHKQEYASVVLDNSKGQSLASFTTVRQQPRVLSLLEGSGSITEREPNRGIRPRESPTEVPL